MNPRNLEEFMSEARRRFSQGLAAEREIRAEAAEDLRFVSGDQWNPKTKQDRIDAGRPVLTINKLPTFVQQVVNEARQNKPAMKINPVDSGADRNTADVYGGLIRHIEYHSDAEIAYDTGFECAVSGSFGYWMVVTEYSDDRSFDQDIRIRRIPDPFAVVMDPAAKEYDRSDAEWAFITDRISKAEFKRRWPKAQVVSQGFYSQSGIENPAPDWIGVGDGGDFVQIAEYWVVEKQRRTLVLLIDGRAGYREEAQLETIDPDSPERVVEVSIVKQYVINGVEILEERDWPGRWIPLVPIYGKELWVRGKRHLFSLVRFARDPQMLYNYYTTNEAEVISLTPRAPYIGYVGQFKTKQADWAAANIKNLPYLEADPITVGGQIAPLPQRNQIEAPIQALSAGKLQASDDIKATTGIFDASLGARSNETSGVAILRRQAEGDVSNYHFLDNLSRSLRHTGRILLDLIPHIYDTAREVRILGEDQTEKVVMLNAPYRDERGRPQQHDLDVGRYDVTVTTGPSYTTRRLEAFDLLTQLARAYPQLLQIAGDVIFQNSDIPGSEVIADRFKAMLPPPLQAEKDQAVPPQIQAQLAALAQQTQELQAALAAAQQELKQRVAEKRLEVDSKERIAQLNAQVDLIKAEMQINADKAEALLRAELEQINQRLQILHESRMQEQDHAHEAAMTAMGGGNASEGEPD